MNATLHAQSKQTMPQGLAGHKNILHRLAKKLLLLLPALIIGTGCAFGQSWNPLGPNDTNQPSLSGTALTKIATDVNGVPYVAYQDAGNGGKVSVKMYNGTTWVTVGMAGFSTGLVNYLSLAISGTTPYVAYQDVSQKATVMMYNGSSWVTVGAPGFSAGTANYTSLAFNGATPYVAYEDVANGNYATLMMYNGSAWVTVGAAGFSAGVVAYTSLAFNGTTPYVAYEDAANNGSATVMMYDGANWITVGAADFSASAAQYLSLAFNGTTPYVVYADYANNNKATVQLYNGASWVTVGAADFSVSVAQYLSLAFNGGTPYVSFEDFANSEKTTVMMYNGANWVTVGTAGFSAGAATYISLAFNGTTPFVVYSDGSTGNKAVVQMYNGANWVTVGSTGFSAGTTAYTSMAFNSTTPYVAYQDAANGNAATVQLYNGTSWVTVGGAGFSAGAAAYTSLAFNGAAPYVAYSDAANGNKATVMMYNGANWVTVGTPGFSAGAATYTSLAINGGTPYVAYSDAGNSGAVTVMMYNGASWVPLGSAGFSAQTAAYTKLAFNGTTPYVAFRDGNSFQNKVTVEMYNGSSWANVGTRGFSPSAATYPSLAFAGGIPYVAYIYGSTSFRLEVEQFNGATWSIVGTTINVNTTAYPSLAIYGTTPYIAYADAANGNEATAKMFNGTSWATVGTADFSALPASYLSLALNGPLPYVAYSSVGGAYVKYFGAIAPTTQATNVTFSNTTTSASTISWTNGNGAARAVFMYAGASGSAGPANITTYNANPTFGTGDQIGTSGWYCVYNGTGSSVNVTGLASGTAYQVMTTEYNGSGGNFVYLTAAGAGNPAGVTTLPPVITISGTPSALSTTAGTASSSTNFNVSAVNLNGNITVTAPAGFDVSPDNATWTTQGSPSFVIVPVSGTITSAPVYIQLDAADAANTYSGNVAVTAGGATEVDVAIPASTVSLASTTITSIIPVLSGPTRATAVDYTVTFASALTTPPSTGDFTLTGAATGTIHSVTGSGTTYDVNVTNVSGNGSLELDMTGGSDASLTISNVPFTGGAYTIDNTPPTALTLHYFSSNAGNSQVAAVGNVVSLDFTTSEAISVPSLLIAGHAVTATNVNGNQWLGTYTMTNSDTEGRVPFTLSFTDLAGNPQPGSPYTDMAAGDDIEFDKTAPTAAISAPSVAGIGNNGTGSVSYTITYADANFNTSNLTGAGIALNNPTGTATGTVTVSGSGTSYTVTISNISGTGTLGISLAGGYASDQAGNTDAGAGPSATFNVLSSDAALANFTISNGTLINSFSPGTFTYTDAIANFTSGITVVPTTDDPNATITVDGNLVASGVRTSSIPMAAGANTLTMVVTAADGVTTQTYTITVNRAFSSDALLTSLKTTPATSLAIVTGPAYVNYTTTVAAATGSITITPTEQDATATIAVNGQAVASGTASQPVALTFGTNVINTVVTAQDGSTKTYNMNITRPQSANALLTSIKTTPVYGLTIVSGPDYVDYTASVPNATGSITVTATTQDATATMTINGHAVPSGNPSKDIALTVGANTITTVVTAQDGVTTKTYTITVTRATSTDALLTSIKTTPATNLTIVSGPGYVNYSTTVTNATGSITITPTLQDATATIKVNGTTVASGAASQPIALALGSNTINTVVTAQDGVSTKTYTITVTRGPSTDALLTSIKLTPAANLTIVTGPSYVNYTTSVPNSTGSVTVTATEQDLTATITVNGATTASGTASAPIPLAVGSNTISIVSTAQDGVTTKTYTITATRAMAPVDNVYEPISVTKPADNVIIENDGVTVHQGVSPNGDGINDYLTIDGITNYPDNRLMIMDRNGVMVYQTKGYDNSAKLFDGHSNIDGKMQLPGTYFYSLEYAFNGQNVHKTGYIILKY